MIYRIEKLLNITFQGKTIFGVVFTYSSGHLFQSFDSNMVTLTDTTRKRVLNKCWLKDGIEDSKQSMVNNTITNGCFVNMSNLWIRNIESKISVMFIGFVFQIMMQVKNMLFYVTLKNITSCLLRLPFLNLSHE